ncbi:MAG: FitA-like ribbon-helix-helix domain-containing protein [Terriglobia bacterium]
MPNLTLRKIPKEIYQRLRQSAKSHQRSLNSEILAILSDEDGWSRRRLSIAAVLPELEAARKELAKKYPHLVDSAELIREDRDTR